MKRRESAMERIRRIVSGLAAQSARAFTVAELLIVVSVVAIITVASLPTFTGTIRGYRLRSAAWQIAGDLRLARAKAVSTNRRHRICFNNCGGPVPADGYLIQREEGSGWAIDSVVKPPSGGVRVTSNGTITFAETGDAAGGTVILMSDLESLQVRTHFTGRVRVCPGACP